MAWGGKRKAAAAPDPFGSIGDLIARLEQKTGFKLDTTTVIPDGMSFRDWCVDLGRKGLKVDGKPFLLDDRPAMAWIYDQIPTTADEAYRYILVIMKCAQVGFTVMEILAAIYLGLKFGPCTVGMFLPDQNLAGIKSTERFMPIVRSIPEVHKLMTQDADNGSGKKAGEGNVTKRRLDEALYIFSWTSGRATTESIPMDVLNFDEVQEMTLDQIEKTYERLSASAIRFMLMGSTANWPEADTGTCWATATVSTPSARRARRRSRSTTISRSASNMIPCSTACATCARQATGSTTARPASGYRSGRRPAARCSTTSRRNSASSASARSTSHSSCRRRSRPMKS
jgi:hypothetical protein